MGRHRISNIELLRIISMFFVLVVHSCSLSLGFPTQELTTFAPYSTLGTFFLSSLSVVCVDVFVIISGWFGITFKGFRLCSLLFQVLFYSCVVLLVSFFAFEDLTIDSNCIKTFLLLNGNDYWFVKSYILLMLLAPMINSFLVSSDEMKIRHFLIVFFIIQTIFAWLSIDGILEFGGGYSVLSFLGLYVLIRYIRLYWYEELSFSSSQYFFVYFLIAIIQTVLGFCVTRLGYPIAGRLFTYTNPLVIIQSVALVLAFASLKPFHSKFVNWMAASSLSVYLLHAHELVLRPHFGPFVLNLFQQNSYPIFLFYTLCFLIAVFFVSVLLDQIRILFWNFLFKLYQK